MSAEDPENGGQAEPASALLGGEERFPDALHRRDFHAGAVVDHLEEHGRAGRHAVSEQERPEVAGSELDPPRPDQHPPGLLTLEEL